ncbi:MAG: sigma-70 family RNA polymerase sigma factor [Methylobacter sp.]|uniref:sigma-70 family RNA polymerase sigma factor n=1 Tax=Methylobacter sp. TaxID=2051955 RepID=UPI00258B4683|nr:sigma-70 family RNA polymerase sigma factor [Methylobacter sp.]MCL7419742.1 sigma-70 family RNA polymerase sigma factor [Methylobacter sp.]
MSRPEQWLGLYGDVLYRYALARVRAPEIAEDLVQETFLAALKAKAHYAGEATEQTWLIGILKHKIIDHFRKASRDKSQAFDERVSMDEESEYFDSQGSWQIDLSSWDKPDKSLEQEQFLNVLQDCIDRLPPRMAQLFVLRELEGMESEEICKTMSISTLNNFWVMMSRVRLQLRHCLDLKWF